MVKIIRIDGKFYFAEDDKELVECKTWLETSKKSAKNPDGKLHILLPKDNSVNRQYLAVDKFNAEAVNEELILTVKESAPRVLGATGVKQTIIPVASPDENFSLSGSSEISETTASYTFTALASGDCEDTLGYVVYLEPEAKC